MSKECFLVEDDLDDQEIFLMALKRVDEQINCFVAIDGVEGLKILSDSSYTPLYIFIDINMPKMNGIQFLQRIKKLDHLSNSKIIMYSTSADAAVIGECKELGADSFLAKPPGIGTLVASLSNIFKG